MISHLVELVQVGLKTTALDLIYSSDLQFVANQTRMPPESLWGNLGHLQITMAQKTAIQSLYSVYEMLQPCVNMVFMQFLCVLRIVFALNL